jgi:hypothetical protein
MSRESAESTVTASERDQSLISESVRAKYSQTGPFVGCPTAQIKQGNNPMSYFEFELNTIKMTVFFSTEIRTIELSVSNSIGFGTLGLIDKITF